MNSDELIKYRQSRALETYDETFNSKFITQFNSLHVNR